MIKYRILLLILFLFQFYNSSSQITITKIEKRIEEEEVSAPPPYDSLEIPKNVNQYIGLKVFYPPFNDKQLTDRFLSSKPSVLKSVENEEYANSIDCDSLLTFQYKPISFLKERDSGYYCKVTQGNDEGMVGKDGFLYPIGSQSERFYSKCKDLGDRYYTVINVLTIDSLFSFFGNLLAANKTSIESKVCVPQINSDLFGGWAFVLKNDALGDTIYHIGNLTDFILVPYYMKLKKMFDGQTFIEQYDSRANTDYIIKKDIVTNEKCKIKFKYGSTWKCEVTLLDYDTENDDEKDQTNWIGHWQNYRIAFILKNESNTIAFFNNKIKLLPYSGFSSYLCPFSFKLIDVFTEQEKQKKLKKIELLAKQEKEEQIRVNNEKIAKQKHLKYCIEKFGESNGKRVADGKIRIGMTREMCEIAWGRPFDKDKTITEFNIIEVWYYGWKKTLYFNNDILKQIKE